MEMGGAMGGGRGVVTLSLPAGRGRCQSAALQETGRKKQRLGAGGTPHRPQLRTSGNRPEERPQDPQLLLDPWEQKETAACSAAPLMHGDLH